MNVNKILCCVDFSPNAEKAFTASMDLAEKYGATLHLLHVLPPVISPLITDIDIAVPDDSSGTLVQKLGEQMQDEYGKKIDEKIHTSLVIREGHVSSEILNYIEDENIDLIVLGAYGLTGVELVLFGSVAKRVAHKAKCSVMIVR